MKVCSVPDWWSPPWTAPHKQHQSNANRGRRPLHHKEWDQRRRTRSPFPTRVSGAQIAVTRDPSRPRQSHVKPAVVHLDNVVVSWNIAYEHHLVEPYSGSMLTLDFRKVCNRGATWSGNPLEDKPAAQRVARIASLRLVACEPY